MRSCRSKRRYFSAGQACGYRTQRSTLAGFPGCHLLPSMARCCLLPFGYCRAIGINPLPERKSREAGSLLSERPPGPEKMANRKPCSLTISSRAPRVPHPLCRIYHRRPAGLAGVARNYRNHNTVRTFGESLQPFRKQRREIGIRNFGLKHIARPSYAERLKHSRERRPVTSGCGWLRRIQGPRLTRAKACPKGNCRIENQLLGNSLSVALSKCLSAASAFARCPTSSPESL
jgi:hypothetical protein